MRDFSNLYLTLLKNDFSGLNLTRILDNEEFYQKQIVDSLAPLENYSWFKDILKKRGLMIDVGFGGGFPLLPMAKVFPAVEFIGFEARGKKAAAVHEIATKLNLKNVQTFHKRVETILFDKECLITFKAVGKVSDILRRINSVVPLVVIFYKGPSFDEIEGIDELPRGWEMFDRSSYNVDGGSRNLLAYRFSKVPRGTNFNKKGLASLTELIE